MMRRAERPPPDQRLVRRQQVRHAVDARHLERLLDRQRRQDRRQRARHERFARAGRAAHEAVVVPGRRDLQRALGMLLPLYFAEIHIARPVVLRQRRRRLRLDRLMPCEVIHQLQQALHRDHFETRDQGRLVRVRARHEQRMIAVLPRVRRDGQHPAHVAHRPVQRQLAHEQRRLRQFARDLLRRHQDAHRDRQVIPRPRLAQVRRRQVDDRPVQREMQPVVADRRAHAFAGLLHRRVRQPHNREERHAGERHVDLDMHDLGVDAGDGTGSNAGEHRAPL